MMHHGKLVGWLVWKGSLVMGGGSDISSTNMVILSYDVVAELDVVIAES